MGIRRRRRQRRQFGLRRRVAAFLAGHFPLGRAGFRHLASFDLLSLDSFSLRLFRFLFGSFVLDELGARFRFHGRGDQLQIREDELVLGQRRGQIPAQMIAKLLQGGEDGDFVDGARELGAAGRRRRHDEDVGVRVGDAVRLLADDQLLLPSTDTTTTGRRRRRRRGVLGKAVKENLVDALAVEDGDARAVLLDFGEEDGGAIADFRAREVAAGGRGPLDDVREPDAKVQKASVVFEREGLRDESRKKEALPKMISGTGIVTLLVGRDQTRVDSWTRKGERQSLLKINRLACVLVCGEEGGE